MAGSVAIVTVNYGTAGPLLERIARYLPTLDGLEARLFIVDNASPGGDGARLVAGVEAMRPAPVPITVIEAPLNGGFAAGNNLAFAALRDTGWRPDAVLLLNPDAEPEPGAVRLLLEGLMARPRAGFAGPTLVNEDGTTWSAAFRFPSWRTEVLRQLGIGALERFCTVLAETGEAPARVDWIGGASLLVRWEALLALGDLDEGYFLYMEEVDYQREAARQGWESWHIPAARVAHAAGESTGIEDGRPRQGRMPPYLFESWTRYFVKQHGRAATRAIAAGRLAAILLGRLKSRLRGRGGALPERFVRDYLEQVLFRRLDPVPAAATAGRTAEAMAARRREAATATG